jgi:hypothetical protein
VTPAIVTGSAKARNCLTTSRTSRTKARNFVLHVLDVVGQFLAFAGLVTMVSVTDDGCGNAVAYTHRMLFVSRRDTHCDSGKYPITFSNYVK